MDKIVINGNNVFIAQKGDDIPSGEMVKSLGDVADMSKTLLKGENKDYVITMENVTADPKEYLLGVAKCLKKGIEYNLNLYKKLILNPYELFEIDEDYLYELIVMICKVNKKIVEENMDYTYLSDVIMDVLDVNEHEFNRISLSMVVSACIGKELQIMNTEECYEIRDMFVLLNMGISQDVLKASDMAKSLSKLLKDDLYITTKVAKRITLGETEMKIDEALLTRAFDNICFTEEDMKE